MNEFLESEENFPDLLPLAIEIEHAVDDPESSFEDIARIVESDPQLSSQLLALANSSFYNYPIAIATIPDALSVIGLRNTRNLSIALSLPQRTRAHASFPVNMDAFWRYSLAVGLCTRLIALECREANTERHFLAGFLHKINRPFMGRIYPDQTKSIFNRAQKLNTNFQTLAQKELGFDEAEISAATLIHWRFPENIYTLVRHHNKPVLARAHLRGVSFVHIATFIVSALNIGDSGDRFVPEFSEAAWGYAQFEESKIANVVEELFRQLENVCKVFLSPASA